jgi:hypothetical protein
MAIAMWMLSAALAVWLPGMVPGAARPSRRRLGPGVRRPRVRVCGLASHIAVDRRPGPFRPPPGAQPAAPWLLLLALASTGASLLAAL